MIGYDRVAWECPRCHKINAPHVDSCICTAIPTGISIPEPVKETELDKYKKIKPEVPSIPIPWDDPKPTEPWDQYPWDPYPFVPQPWRWPKTPWINPLDGEPYIRD